MTIKIDDWDLYARNLGYNNEREMLVDYYLVKKMSISEIALCLDVGTHTLNRHLTLASVIKRGRGGANNPSAQSRKLFHLDQRIIHYKTPAWVSQATGISSSLCYKYKNMKGAKNGVLHSEPDRWTNSVQYPEQPSLTPTTSDEE